MRDDNSLVAGLALGGVISVTLAFWLGFGAPTPEHGAFAEWTIAFFTGVTAAILGATALYTRRAIRDARRSLKENLDDATRTRHGQLATDLSRRWDDPAMTESLKRFTEYRSDGINTLHEQMFNPPDQGWKQEDLDKALDLYHTLHRWPNLMDMIGVLESTGIISTEFVYSMWGPAIVSAWTLWKEPVEHLRELERDRGLAPNTSGATYQAFETLAGKLEKMASVGAVDRPESPPEAEERAEPSG